MKTLLTLVLSIWVLSLTGCMTASFETYGIIVRDNNGQLSKESAKNYEEVIAKELRYKQLIPRGAIFVENPVFATVVFRVKLAGVAGDGSTVIEYIVCSGELYSTRYIEPVPYGMYRWGYPYNEVQHYGVPYNAYPRPENRPRHPEPRPEYAPRHPEQRLENTPRHPERNLQPVPPPPQITPPSQQVQQRHIEPTRKANEP